MVIELSDRVIDAIHRHDFRAEREKARCEPLHRIALALDEEDLRRLGHGVLPVPGIGASPALLEARWQLQGAGSAKPEAGTLSAACIRGENH